MRPSKVPSGVPTRSNGTGAGLVLELVREIIRKNRGMMKVKSHDEKAMTFVSLILPIERRRVVQFPPLRPSAKKQDG